MEKLLVGIDAKAVKYYEDDVRLGTPINTAFITVSSKWF